VRPTRGIEVFALNTPERDPLGFSSTEYTPPRTVDITFTRDIERSPSGRVTSETSGLGVSTVSRLSTNTRVARVTLDRTPSPGTYSLAISELLRSSDGLVTYTGPETVEFTVESTDAGFTATARINTARNVISLTFYGGSLHSSINKALYELCAHIL